MLPLYCLQTKPNSQDNGTINFYNNHKWADKKYHSCITIPIKFFENIWIGISDNCLIESFTSYLSCLSNKNELPVILEDIPIGHN